MLVIDGDPVAAEVLAQTIASHGYRAATAHNHTEALNLLADAAESPIDGPFAVTIIDDHTPIVGGIELIKLMRKRHPGVVPVMLSGFGKLHAAVEAIRLGAADYLTKPVVDEELLTAVQRAEQQHALLAENANLRSQLTERYGLDSMVGRDHKMQKIYDLVEAVAESRSTILITGESGTGKSIIAKAIHARSPRTSAPFITFACGAIPETLLESELFGHVKGAFTGADQDKPGKVLAAEGGTLFIDEINSATANLQVKLLRVLQEKAFEPVGATRTREVDVRFLLATNQPLEDLVAEGRFREDLFYRINVVNIHLPPLRERSGDVALLAEHFLEKYCQEMNRTRRLSDATVEALSRYDWPGNVRELENAMERAVLLSRTATVEPDDLPATITGNDPRRRLNGNGLGTGHDASSQSQGADASMIPALNGGWTPTPLVEALFEPERQILLAALQANGWNRQETSRQLNINRTTLYKKIKQFGLEDLATG